MGGGMSVHLEPMTANRYTRTDHAVCGSCLDRMGVIDMLAEERMREAERNLQEATSHLRMAKKDNVAVVDVTPKELGPGRSRMRLLASGQE